MKNIRANLYKTKLLTYFDFVLLEEPIDLFLFPDIVDDLFVQTFIGSFDKK